MGFSTKSVHKALSVECGIPQLVLEIMQNKMISSIDRIDLTSGLYSALMSEPYQPPFTIQ